VYAEEKGFLAEDTEGYPDETGYATLEELMRAVYAHGDQWRDAWLYDEETPPMPNHPDWTVDPVEASVAALRQARAARPTP
jgi:hypothetical protein